MSSSCWTAISLWTAGGTHDRGRSPHQALQKPHRGVRSHFHGATGPGDRLPGTQRRGQVHHHAHDPGPGPTDPRHRHCGGPALRRLRRPAARSGRAPRRRRDPRRPHRPQSPAPARAEQPHHRRPGRRGAWSRRPRRCREPPCQGFLAGDAAAPGHRRRAAGRPAGADPRRAGQRARPGGHPLDPASAGGLGGRGAYGAGLQPSDERNGPVRRSPGRHRQRAAALRHADGRVRGTALAAGGARRDAAPG